MFITLEEGSDSVRHGGIGKKIQSMWCLVEWQEQKEGAYSVIELEHVLDKDVWRLFCRGDAAKLRKRFRRVVIALSTGQKVRDPIKGQIQCRGQSRP